MATDITNVAALSRDVDGLRERFTQTQELYREVAALLFFRYGITPTANKLYQLVRKGSMSAPADALTKFWEELREKSRTRIEHPDLPETLKTAAGELIATLWTTAQKAAQESFAVYKNEAQERVVEAKAALATAQSDRDAVHVAAQALKSDLGQALAQVSAQGQKLAAAEATHISLTAMLNDAKDVNAALQQQLNQSRHDFAVELDKLQAAMGLAEERSRATEKRALLDMDRERTATAKLQKEHEALHAESTQAADHHRKELTLLQELLGDIRQKSGQLEGSLQAVTASQGLAILEAKQLQVQLNETSAQKTLFHSQAQEWRRKAEKTQRQLLESQTTHKRMRRKRKAAITRDFTRTSHLGKWKEG